MDQFSMEQVRSLLREGKYVEIQDNEADDALEYYVRIRSGCIPPRLIMTYGGHPLLRQKCVADFVKSVNSEYPPPVVLPGSPSKQDYTEFEGCGYIDPEIRTKLLMMQHYDVEHSREFLRHHLESCKGSVAILLKTSPTDLVAVLKDAPTLWRKIIVLWSSPLYFDENGDLKPTFNYTRDRVASDWLKRNTDITTYCCGGGISKSFGLRNISDSNELKECGQWSILEPGLNGMRNWVENTTSGRLFKCIYTNFNHKQYEKWRQELGNPSVLKKKIRLKGKEFVANMLSCISRPTEHIIAVAADLYLLNFLLDSSTIDHRGLMKKVDMSLIRNLIEQAFDVK